MNIERVFSAGRTVERISILDRRKLELAARKKREAADLRERRRREQDEKAYRTMRAAANKTFHDVLGQNPLVWQETLRALEFSGVRVHTGTSVFCGLTLYEDAETQEYIVLMSTTDGIIPSWTVKPSIGVVVGKIKDERVFGRMVVPVERIESKELQRTLSALRHKQFAVHSLGRAVERVQLP